MGLLLDVTRRCCCNIVTLLKVLLRLKGQTQLSFTLRKFLVRASDVQLLSLS